MTKKIRKYIVKGISIYLLLISICCSLLFLSFSLDGDIETNASIGICEISNGEIYPKVLEHYLPMPWTYFLSSWAHYLQQDRFTDREMLKAVITPGDNIFERAMVPEYGRYWHGYLVFLRPILMFFPYEEIKYIGLIIHIFGISIIYFRKKIFWNIKCGMPLLFIGGMPVLWVCILANHSAIHYWFTARIFMISCFALLVYIYKINNYKNNHGDI